MPCREQRRPGTDASLATKTRGHELTNVQRPITSCTPPVLTAWNCLGVHYAVYNAQTVDPPAINFQAHKMNLARDLCQVPSGACQLPLGSKALQAAPRLLQGPQRLRTCSSELRLTLVVPTQPAALLPSSPLPPCCLQRCRRLQPLPPPPPPPWPRWRPLPCGWHPSAPAQ